MKDTHAHITGMFEMLIIDARTGRVIGHERGPNLIVDGAKPALAQLLGSGDVGRVVTEIAFGSNGAAPVTSDAQLTDEYRRGILSADYPQPSQVRFRWQLDDLEANGLSIREYGLYTDDGTLFARKVRVAPIEKTLLIRLEGLWTIQF